MSTTFAYIPPEKIHVHPSNVRFAAVADDAMVASIRSLGILDPVMVAPHPEVAGEYRLIDGHRRRDGAEKAGLSTLPAYIREDLVTEIQQIEVMVATAVHREDLTAVEESAAYEQLELFGMTPAQMSASTGRPESTIKDRLKLRRLTDTARSRLHEGQMTLGDAEALLEFADDPASVARLEQHIGSENFRYQVQREKDARDRKAADQALRKRAATEGIPLTNPMSSMAYWNQNEGPYRLDWMDRWPFEDAATEDAHDGCLAVTEHDGRLFVTCTEPKKHRTDDTSPGVSDEQRAERDAQWARDREAREAAQARRVAAAKVRVEHLAGHFAGLFTTKTVDKKQLAALRVTVTATLMVSEGFDTGAYAHGLGLDAAETAEWGWSVPEEHIATLVDLTPAKFLKVYAALLAAQVEWRLDQGDHALEAWSYLTSTGYDLSDVDEELLAEARTQAREAAA